MAKERHPVAFLLGAALGGACGAVYGLLNAPRAGAKTRADLTERWHQIEDQAERGIVEIETQVNERVDQVIGGATMDGPARS
jgi:gas vesicle protein